MCNRLSALTVAALLLGAGLATAAPIPGAPAPPGAVDLIPEDAAGGIAIRNLADLIKKGDKFVEAGGLGDSLRPSQLFTFLYAFQGIKDVVDQDAGAAVLIANPELLGVKLFDNNGAPSFPDVLNLLVIVVPFKDADKIGACFNIEKGALQPGKVVKGEGKNDIGKFFTVRDKHLIYGNNEKVVTAVAKAKPTGSALAADRRKALNEADGVLHLSPKVLGDHWTTFLKEMETELTKNADDTEQRAAHQLTESLTDIRYLLATMHIDDGLGVSLLTVFPKEKNEATKKLLAAFQGSVGSSDLNGLPEGRVVAAEGSKADGAQNAAFMKLLVNLFYKEYAQTKLLSASSRSSFAGVFTEVWQRLKGSRFALYHNADETKHGLFSLVAILDTEDPEQFLKDMQKLAHFADGATFDLTAKNPRKEDVAEVEQLIRDLGSNKYEVRQSASLKLGLIGEPALPYLEKALASDDAEVRRRAKDLKESLEESAALRKKEVLAKEPIPHVKPTFVFLPKAETTDGHKIDVVGIKLEDRDFAAVKHFTQLFGPDWDKARIAVHGKQVIVVLGSDPELLKTVLKNVKDGAKGLGEAKRLEAFAKHADPGRKMEFHVSMQTLLAASEEDWKLLSAVVPKRSVTSFALTVDPDRLQLDLWIPMAEVKVIAKKSGVP
jgi:hypothetical protein